MNFFFFLALQIWPKIKNYFIQNVLHNYYFTGDRCKTRWNNIRDNYKKSLKKMRQNKNIKPYRFSWQLGFLKKYYERELRANPNLTISEDDESKPESKPDDVEEEAAQEDKSSIATTDCEVVISVPKPQPLNLRKRKLIRETPSSMLMKYLIDKSAQGTTTQDQLAVSIKHPVDAFLFALSPTLKSLPQDLLTLAKSEIFACVQKYEMKRNNSRVNDPAEVENIVVETSQPEEEEEIRLQVSTSADKFIVVIY